MNTGLILKGIEKKYGKSIIFKNIDLHVLPGTLVAIKGKSGVGKSTLLNIIAGLELPTSGTYFLDNVNMSNKNFKALAEIRKKRIGYISQHSPMIPGLTAFENIYIPLWLDKKKDNEDHSIDEKIEISKKFGVYPLLHKKIDKLSGGERQRVAIIRALMNNPKVIVADEPTGSLDDETAIKIVEYFQSLKGKGISIVIATHSELVANLCDQIYLLSKDGLISQKKGELFTGSDEKNNLHLT